MRQRHIMQMDRLGVSVSQLPVNGFDISYNPDDKRFYVCDKNAHGDLETVATFAGDDKGLANAREYARKHKPR